MDAINPALQSWTEGILGATLNDACRTRSGDNNTVFKITAAGRSAFLKSGPRLAPEHQRLLWLRHRVAAPEVLGWRDDGAVQHLLLGVVPGTDVAQLSAVLHPSVIVSRLARALRLLHAIDAADCPFENGSGGDVIVHGDACLPNFMFLEDIWTGIIDVGDCGRGKRETDLAAAVWSLQYNMGPGWGLQFLIEYGIADATEEYTEELRGAYQ